MGKRINIGVYIGPQDTDIAAWFNLLQDHNLSRAKWVRGLFSAYAMNQKIPIGTVNINAPLVKESVKQPKGETPMFGTGSSQSETIRRDKYGYGWQIRGPQREFIHGSVINVSVSKAEFLPILEESWKNGHQLATFLKALIRDNLVYGDAAIPPKMEDLQKVCSAYLVQQNNKKVVDSTPHRQKPERDDSQTKKPAVKPPKNEEPTASQTPDKEKSPGTAPSPKAFNFAGVDSEVKKVRNPLLSQI